MVGSTYQEKISDPGNRLHRLLKAGTSDGEIIEELYLRALGRFPTDRSSPGWSRWPRPAIRAGDSEGHHVGHDHIPGVRFQLMAAGREFRHRMTRRTEKEIVP